MRNIFTIFSKEIYRVVSDLRLVVMVFLLPGLSIFLMYTLMGNVIQDQATAIQEHQIILYEDNMPDTLKQQLIGLDLGDDRVLNIELHSVQNQTDDELADRVRDGDIDIVLLFDEDFETAIVEYQTMSLPSLKVFYNYGRQQSSFSYNQVMTIIRAYEESVRISRLDDPEHYFVFETVFAENTVDERQMAGQGLAMLMPMLIIIFLFAGAMSIGPDAIAGEKERNTIATLLITPTKRSEIALGKVISLSVLSLMSAISAFIGIILSLPNLMMLENGAGELNIYRFSDYLSILIVLMSTVLLIVGLISIISAYAKTIKEASMLIMPFYFITLIVGIVTSFGAEPNQAFIIHLIPIYGAVNLLSGIFVFNWGMLNLMAVVISSVVYTAIFVYVLNKMFNSEKIMFQK